MLRTAALATLPLVDGDGGTSLNQTLVAEVERMLRDGTIEGLTIRLRRAFPTLAADADGAVGHAVEKLVVRPVAPTNPGAYLTASARNEMTRLVRERARHHSLEALSGGRDDEFGTGWEPAAGGWTVEEQALLTATYERLRTHVQTWDTENLRVVTLLFLEAAFVGEPLPSKDAAEIAGDVLGYEVDDNFVRTWKSRGFKLLRTYVKDADTAERHDPLDREEIR